MAKNPKKKPAKPVTKKPGAALAKKKAPATKAAKPRTRRREVPVETMPAAEPAVPDAAPIEAPETEAAPTDVSLTEPAPADVPSSEAAPTDVPSAEAAPAELPAPVQAAAGNPGRAVVEMHGKLTLRTIGEQATRRLEEVVVMSASVEELRYRYDKAHEYAKARKKEFDEASASLLRRLSEIRKIVTGEQNLPLLRDLAEPVLPLEVVEVIKALKRADYTIDPIVANGLSENERRMALEWAKAEEQRLAYLKAGDEAKALLVVVPALPICLARLLPNTEPAAAEAAPAEVPAPEPVEPVEPVDGAAAAPVDEALEATAPKGEYLRAALLNMLDEDNVPDADALAQWPAADRIDAYKWASDENSTLDEAPECVKRLLSSDDGAAAAAVEEMGDSTADAGNGDEPQDLDEDLDDEPEGLGADDDQE